MWPVCCWLFHTELTKKKHQHIENAISSQNIVLLLLPIFFYIIIRTVYGIVVVNCFFFYYGLHSLSAFLSLDDSSLSAYVVMIWCRHHFLITALVSDSITSSIIEVIFFVYKSNVNICNFNDHKPNNIQGTKHSAIINISHKVCVILHYLIVQHQS